MPPILEKCERCGKSCYPNELVFSAHHGGKVCRGCTVDQGPGEHLNRATETVKQWPEWKKNAAGFKDNNERRGDGSGND